MGYFCFWMQVSCPGGVEGGGRGGDEQAQSRMQSPRLSVPVRSAPPSERRSC